MSMMFEKMALHVCNRGYLIVWEAVVSLSLLVDGILSSLLSDDLSLSLHLALCRFSPVSVLYVLLQCWHFKCSVDREFWLTLLTGYNGEVWKLGWVLFNLSDNLVPCASFHYKRKSKKKIKIALWTRLLAISYGAIIFIQSEEQYGTWVGIFRSFLINASRFIVWFQHTLIYKTQRQLWKSMSISHC